MVGCCCRVDLVRSVCCGLVDFLSSLIGSGEEIVKPTGRGRRHGLIGLGALAVSLACSQPLPPVWGLVKTTGALRRSSPEDFVEPVGPAASRLKLSGGLSLLRAWLVGLRAKSGLRGLREPVIFMLGSGEMCALSNRAARLDSLDRLPPAGGKLFGRLPQNRVSVLIGGLALGSEQAPDVVQRHTLQSLQRFGTLIAQLLLIVYTRQMESCNLRRVARGFGAR